MNLTFDPVLGLLCFGELGGGKNMDIFLGYRASQEWINNILPIHG